MDQEHDLIRRAQRGDEAARDRLWVAFHQFAVAEARRLALRKGVEPDEAEGEAAIAVLEAIDGFDLHRNVRFSTYLAQRLTGTTMTLARTERRQTRFDTAHYQPGPPVPEYQKDKPPPGCFWSPKALAWAKRVRRRSDRLIIKWLWLDARPRSQSEIARKLGISRSAVCQRRRVLINRIHRLDPTALFEQYVSGKSLNRFWP